MTSQKLNLYWRFKLESRSAVPSRPHLNHCSLPTSGLAFNAIRAWLADWEAHRPPWSWDFSIRNGARRISAPSPIRCLDVVSHKLVAISLNDHYVCLSYVLGDLDLKTRRCSFFREDDRVNVEELSRTIQDTITVVRNLGETYLWTDILCIDQSNDDDLSAQVAQMDLIYQAGLCALVALDGRNADSGLPGIRPGSRKEIGYCISIHGANLVAGPHNPFSKTIEAGYWQTRGLTFQKGFLSRRCLFFGDHEVLLQTVESIGRESIDALSLRESRLQDRHFEPTNGIDIIWRFQTFRKRVADYVSRQLTYDSDILRAFTGILEWISHDIGMPFVYETPQNDLLNGLQWPTLDAEKEKQNFVPEKHVSILVMA